ncbi:MAG: hypothetical protein A2268_05485 [Candidatus Raymondbacteria bacterium RifOxyA12_full_50_37]|uniref:Uncharacterized protein n=1 Tax=Candidatus Raymondbacteria bacterium RIFOXYD12_FULL_49_13 TaxID=1817890 RepID=A0A1F7FBJ1_UNCRA|nr:MAG: hypothetical protein A2268_05485 [Candidatus Raymondbacteria bacterium RifOxyA12_full_50_37]OGJ89017.1 MAG: hypothetical protein A2248_02720 [Candidatus Raymondbacteria bacterium RIFOXYA2_FULL_49_16]OGJ97044.1 MAG: hypothetical protein A2453_04135 [Candidatus Raymondbacteria bacterium RIFOXYC2_FULL_50_21]OGK04040.1 MAG: hypothetical protein A2519_00875 [Candidatus Raymondbacteria bacterium RIFOXYD12_FULL_49_13]OGP42017.1 MAG: hypothetical protein A2324_17805 [Candidatus Raymondbacteria 
MKTRAMLLVAAAVFAADDPLCTIYLETRTEFLAARSDTGLAAAVASADSLQTLGQCMDAVDLLYEWEAAHTADMSGTMDPALNNDNDIDIGLDAVTLSLPVKKSGRTVTHTFVARTDYYSSASDAGAEDSAYAYMVLDTLMYDTIPGYPGFDSNPWNFGAEYRFSTRNNKSAFRMFANRLALYRDYMYDQARTTFKKDLFNDAAALSLGGEFTLNKSNANDSTSYADLIVSPGVALRPLSWFSAGITATVNRRQYQNEREGYENRLARMAGLSVAAQKELFSFSAGIEAWNKRYSVLLWPEKNNKDNLFTVNADFFPMDRLTVSLGLMRDAITYYDKPEGPDNEVSSALEAAIALAEIGPFDFSLNGFRESVRYGQYDSLSYFDLSSGHVIDTAVFTRYQTIKNSLSPEIEVTLVSWLSATGTFTVENLKVSLPNGTDTGLVVPNEDDYFLIAWSAEIETFRSAFSAGLGTTFENIMYQPRGEQEYRVRSLRLNGNANYYFSKKLFASLVFDVPMPWFTGENNVADNSFTVELEYTL